MNKNSKIPLKETKIPAQPPLANNEWQYYILVKDIPAKGVEIKTQTSPEQNTAICERLNLPKLKKFSASGILKPTKLTKLFELSGELMAEITAISAKDGQEIPLKIKEEFFVSFTFDQDSEEHEPIIDGKIDIAEHLIQSLSLAIPDYPGL